MALIAVDFDGTCVTHMYPEIGADVGAVPVLKELVEAGHKLILWTMRSDTTLEQAVSWFKSHDIPLYGINKNPQQFSWTRSPKAYAQLYLDDAALGIPLKRRKGQDRPFVNWEKVRKMLVKRGYLQGA